MDKGDARSFDGRAEGDGAGRSVIKGGCDRSMGPEDVVEVRQPEHHEDLLCKGRQVFDRRRLSAPIQARHEGAEA